MVERLVSVTAKNGTRFHLARVEFFVILEEWEGSTPVRPVDFENLETADHVRNSAPAARAILSNLVAHANRDVMEVN